MAKQNKDRLLLISHHNSYRIAPYITAAKKSGLDVTIASEGKHSLVSEVANGLHINFKNTAAAVEAIIEEHRSRPFSGILGSDDQTVEIAARAAKVLHLPHNPLRAARASHRKDLARAQLSNTNCPVPQHRIIDLVSTDKNQIDDDQAAGLPWPRVLKPLNMSASCGVIRTNNIKEFNEACERLKPIIATATDAFERSHCLVEEYIDGIEIAYEGYLHHGQLHTITLFDKPDPLSGPYFAETIYATPSVLDENLQQNIRSVIQKACESYGLITGAVHAECRIDCNNRVWILEIASRTIGGDCARMLDNENFDIESLAISLAIDKPLAVTMPEKARGVMMIPVKEKGLLKRVEGQLDANRINHIEKIDIIINPGHELLPLPEGNQYLGYIFASADSTEQVVTAIRRAYACLKIITAPIIRIT